MVHITISIPESLYVEMKKHKQIKWSHAAAKGIQKELLHLKTQAEGKEWFETFSKETQRYILALEDMPSKAWKQWHNVMRQKDKQRMKF